MRDYLDLSSEDAAALVDLMRGAGWDEAVYVLRTLGVRPGMWMRSMFGLAEIRAMAEWLDTDVSL
jgi:hypothetical protein